VPKMKELVVVVLLVCLLVSRIESFLGPSNSNRWSRACRVERDLKDDHTGVTKSLFRLNCIGRNGKDEIGSESSSEITPNIYLEKKEETDKDDVLAYLSFLTTSISKPPYEYTTPAGVRRALEAVTRSVLMQPQQGRGSVRRSESGRGGDSVTGSGSKSVKVDVETAREERRIVLVRRLGGARIDQSCLSLKTGWGYGFF